MKLLGISRNRIAGVLRGGSFNNNGNDNPVVNANGNNGVGNTNINIGFRVVL